MSQNMLDNVIYFIFFLSIMMGLMRGMVKEILSLGTWIAAFIVASTFASPLAAKFTGGGGASGAAHAVSLLAIGVSFLGLFVATMIIGSVINYIVSYSVEAYGISIVNRVLGGLFGFARGFLMVLFFVFIGSMTPLNDAASWKSSSMVNTFKPYAASLGEYVAPGFADLKAKLSSTMRNIQQKAQEGVNKAYQSISR